MAVLFKSITIKTNQARYLPEIDNSEIDVCVYFVYFYRVFKLSVQHCCPPLVRSLLGNLGCLRGYAYISFQELPPGEQCKDMLNVKLDTTS